MVGVDHAALRVGSHPAAADQVGVAIGRQDVLIPRRLEDVVQGLLGERDVLAIVLAL